MCKKKKKKKLLYGSVTFLEDSYPGSFNIGRLISNKVSDTKTVWIMRHMPPVHARLYHYNKLVNIYT